MKMMSLQHITTTATIRNIRCGNVDQFCVDEIVSVLFDCIQSVVICDICNLLRRRDWYDLSANCRRQLMRLQHFVVDLPGPNRVHQAERLQRKLQVRENDLVPLPMVSPRGSKRKKTNDMIWKFERPETRLKRNDDNLK